MANRELSYSEVESAVNKITYNDAIAHYGSLKKQLKSYLRELSDKEVGNAFLEELSESISEALQETVTVKGKKYSKINKLIYQDFPDAAIDIALTKLNECFGQSVGTSSDTLIQQYTQEYYKSSELAENEAKKQEEKAIEKIFEELDIMNAIMTKFTTLSKLNKKVVDYQDIHNMANALVKKIIKNFLNVSKTQSAPVTSSQIKNLGYYLTIISGYYGESITADALAKFFNKMFGKVKKLNVKQVGNVKVKIGGKSQDTPYDVIFGDFLDKDIPKVLEAMCGTVDIGESFNVWGIQNKRAKLPQPFFKKDVNNGIKEEKRILKKFAINSAAFKIGNRAGLLEKFGGKGEIGYHWTKGLEFFGDPNGGNVIEALGARNIIWTANGTAYWTDQFIEAFTESRLRLNFNYILHAPENKPNAEPDARKADNLIVLAFHNQNLKQSLIKKNKKVDNL